jgi:predicted transglutaminase-like cysteine proteinase
MPTRTAAAMTLHMSLARKPALRRCLAAALMSAMMATAPASNLTSITNEQIEQLTEAIGNSEAEKRNIKRRLSGWKALLENPQNRELPDAQKLRVVNDFMHETPFYCDPVMWCMEDYWARPVEFLANDGGDCEDFAIAKYYTLRALGVPEDRLRIVYAVYRRGGAGAFSGAHMVLAYYPTPDAEPLILDNINHDILPGSRRPDLEPIFGFNTGGLWTAKEQKGRVQGTDHYSAWSDHWRRVQSGEPLRSITPEQRKAPQCQALRARSPWCN